MGSVVVAHGLNCSMASGIFPHQEPMFALHCKMILNHWTTREALGNRQVLNAIRCILIQEKQRNIWHTQKRTWCKMEQREIWRCRPWALESCDHKPRIARNYWKLEIKKNRFSCKSLQREQSPAHTLISFCPPSFIYLFTFGHSM